jgi:hypothetical protein
LVSGTNLCEQSQDLTRGRMVKQEKTDIIDDLRNAYELLVEVMENPYRGGYIGLLNKLKPCGRELINLKLFNKKKKVDYKIRNLIEEILSYIDFE